MGETLTRERIAEVERVFAETCGNIRPSEVAALCAMARALLDLRELVSDRDLCNGCDDDCSKCPANSRKWSKP